MVCSSFCGSILSQANHALNDGLVLGPRTSWDGFSPCSGTYFGATSQIVSASIESVVYRAVTAADYELMEEITRPDDVQVSFAAKSGPMNAVTSDDLRFIFGPNYQVSSDKISRKLSHMVGIVKIDDAMYYKVWESLLFSCDVCLLELMLKFFSKIATEFLTTS
mmetsp:Transcript_15775/g.23247  ORF Transcript_15775/g.23247 Transcript_15775/m.23247 type:complete len:164 (+) Transcript_15775:714-1205(+)